MYGSIGKAMACLLNSSSSRNRSWQIAAALAMGIACGLTPFGSLVSLCMLSCIVLAPVHLPVALLTTLATISLAPSIAAEAGQWGQWSLEQPLVLQLVAYLNSLPLVPWLRLNNTVVHGSLLIGATQLIPTFLCTLPFARQLQRLLPGPLPSQTQPLDQGADPPSTPSVSFISLDACSVDSELIGVDSELKGVGSELNAQAHALQDNSQPATHYPQRESAFFKASPAPTPTSIQKVETLLSECRSSDSQSIDASSVAARASKLAASVDDMLMELQIDDNSVSPRIEEHVVTLLANEERRPSTIHLDSLVRATDEPNEMQFVELSMGSKLFVRHAPHNQLAKPDPNHAPLVAQVAQHEEALRYLLQHLREIKKKV